VAAVSETILSLLSILSTCTKLGCSEAYLSLGYRLYSHSGLKELGHLWLEVSVDSQLSVERSAHNRIRRQHPLSNVLIGREIAIDSGAVLLLVVVNCDLRFRSRQWLEGLFTDFQGRN
jgi:hypothetical protein